MRVRTHDALAIDAEHDVVVIEEALRLAGGDELRLVDGRDPVLRRAAGEDVPRQLVEPPIGPYIRATPRLQRE